MKIKSHKKHFLLPTLAFFLVGLIFFVIPLDNLLFGFMDDFTDAYMTNLSVKAGAAFGIARALNAIISVAQSVSLEFFASVNIGAVLEPLNNLIEKFSNIMLLSLAVTGIQIIIFSIGKAIGLRWLLSLSFICLSVVKLCKYFYLNKKGNPLLMRSLNTLFSTLWKTLMILFFVIRLFIPLVSFAGKTCEPFVMEKYKNANEKLEIFTERSKDEMETLGIDEEDSETLKEKEAINNEEEKEEYGNFFSRFFHVKAFSDITKEIGQTRGSFNAKKGLSNIISSMSGIVPYVVDLIIVFLLQTVVLPIAVLIFIRYFLWSFIKSLLDKETGL